MVDTIKSKVMMVVLAVMVMLGTLMVAAPQPAEAHMQYYCGYSYTWHKATTGQYHYTYYGGTNANGYEWNDWYVYQYGYGWIYKGWDWRYC